MSPKLSRFIRVHIIPLIGPVAEGARPHNVSEELYNAEDARSTERQICSHPFSSSDPDPSFRLPRVQVDFSLTIP
jgi:hypothetical protein